jgi:hypothetical protein
MAYNFHNYRTNTDGDYVKGIRLRVIINRSQRSFIGHKFKDDRSLKTVETPWLTQNMMFIHREPHSSSHERTDVSVLMGKLWKMSGIAVQLNIIGGENK